MRVLIVGCSLLLTHPCLAHVMWTISNTGIIMTETGTRYANSRTISVDHFHSTVKIGRTSMTMYFHLHENIEFGSILIARWTPPIIDGPCRIYEDTLPSMNKTEFMISQLWNKAALDMFCPGEWTCEILVRQPGQEDRKLHETRIVARRRKQ